FELLPEERSLVDLLLAEPSTIDELLAGSSLPAARCRRLVYLLLISKSVAPYEEGQQPLAAGGGGVQPQVAPPERGLAGGAAQPAAPASPSQFPLPGGAGPSHSPPGPGVSKSPAARLDRLADLPPQPEGLSAELSERWQKIIARARLIENQNYFEMLGL